MNIALDTNVLVLLARESDAARYVQARLDETAQRALIPLFCVGEFLRVTTEAVPGEPNRTEIALAQLEEWISSQFELLRPGPEYWSTFRSLVKERRPPGAEIFDLQIASLCLDGGVDIMWTFDRRFPQLDRLELVDPLTLAPADRP